MRSAPLQRLPWRAAPCEGGAWSAETRSPGRPSSAAQLPCPQLARATACSFKCATDAALEYASRGACGWDRTELLSVDMRAPVSLFCLSPAGACPAAPKFGAYTNRPASAQGCFMRQRCIGVELCQTAPCGGRTVACSVVVPKSIMPPGDVTKAGVTLPPTVPGKRSSTSGDIALASTGSSAAASRAPAACCGAPGAAPPGTAGRVHASGAPRMRSAASNAPAHTHTCL